MLRGKGNFNALAAVMPLVACATASAAHRVVLSLKVRLSLQVCRREFSAAFHGRPNERVLLYQRASS